MKQRNILAAILLSCMAIGYLGITDAASMDPQLLPFPQVASARSKQAQGEVQFLQPQIEATIENGQEIDTARPPIRHEVPLEFSITKAGSAFIGEHDNSSTPDTPAVIPFSSTTTSTTTTTSASTSTSTSTTTTTPRPNTPRVVINPSQPNVTIVETTNSTRNGAPRHEPSLLLATIIVITTGLTVIV